MIVEAYRKGTVVEAGTEDTVWGVPEVFVVPALVSGRADGGPGRVEACGVSGVSTGGRRDWDVGDLACLDGSVEGIKPCLGQALQDIVVLREAGTPFCSGASQEGRLGRSLEEGAWKNDEPGEPISG